MEPIRLQHGDFTLASGARAMRALLDAHPRLDAVFVASDLMAVDEDPFEDRGTGSAVS